MFDPAALVAVGNLTADPELRYTPAGLAVAEVCIAVNRRKKTANGQWEAGEPSFFPATVFGDMAENVAETLRKGDRVIAAGALKDQTWETREGEKRSKKILHVDEIGPSLKFAKKGPRDMPAPQSDPWGSQPSQDFGSLDQPPF